ncbi:MAG: hypothetical protein HYR88_10685, partial [Verrucomicrobia bacterium]|nr:hypothetical protein [Verrucomicrobiota bacterium]
MQLIKILCGCGQKYAFEVEPADGRLECAVCCPVCGADGREAANAAMEQPFGHVSAPSPGLRIAAAKPPPALSAPERAQRAESPPSRFSAEPKVRSLSLGLAIGGVALAALLCSVAFTSSLWRKQTPTQAPMDGYPRTLKDLDASYATPAADQNAATSYLRGFNLLRLGGPGPISGAPIFGKGKFPSCGAPLQASVKTGVAALVKANEEACRFFEEGSAHDQCRYPVDLNLGAWALTPHTSKLRSAVQLIGLTALFHAEAQDGKRAVQDIMTGLALTRSLEAEPILISQLVRVTSVSFCVASWEQTANRAVAPGESLTNLLGAFQRMEDSEARGEGFTRAIAAERAIWLALLETPDKLLQLLTAPGADLAPELRGRLEARLHAAGTYKEEKNEIESIFQELLEARKASFPDRLRTEALIQQRVTEAARRKLAILEAILPGIATVSSREAESQAQLRLGVTAVALELFRAAHDQR